MNAEHLCNDAFAARYGGEEFTVVIPAASTAAYETCAERILEALRALKIKHEQNAAWGIATVSIGGSRLEVPAGLIGALFRDADAALYRAKEGGRNRAELGS
jgi:diguanylate cyclase (GGDEF)-like protein